MSDTDATTMSKCLSWLARVIEDELIPLLRELRDRLPRETKSAPPAFAQPELPGIHATSPAAVALPVTRESAPSEAVVAPHDTAELPDGLIWTNPADAPAPQDEAKPPKPRARSNTGVVYELIAERYGVDGFRLDDLAGSAAFVQAVRENTRNRVGVASFSRILSTLVRAGAAKRDGRDLYYLAAAPTDEIRARVEEVTRKGNEHRAKAQKEESVA